MVSKKTTRSPKTSPPATPAPAPTPEFGTTVARGTRGTRTATPKPARPTAAAEPAGSRAVESTPAAQGRTPKGALPKSATPKSTAPKVAARKPAAPRPQPSASAVPPKVEEPAPVKRVAVAGGNGAGAPPLVTDEDIRVRAYFLSLEHHGQGSPEYFWMLAERELRRAGGAQ